MQRPMNLRELLIMTSNVVVDAGVPEECRAAAFGKVFDILTDHHSSGIVAGSVDDGSSLSAPISTGLSAISQKLELDLEDVREVYEERDGALHLAIGATLFDKSFASATSQIALLLATGRQVGGYEDATSFKSIREECGDYGKLDGPNFSKTLKSMGKEFRYYGSGRDQSVRVNRVGWARAADEIRNLKGINVS